MHVSFEDDTHYLGFMALHAGAWRRPTENYPWVRHNNGTVYLDLPINDGNRCWGVHFGSPGSAAWSPEKDLPARLAGGGFANPPLLRRMTVKFGQIALDRVKDWILDWKDARPVPNPVSIIPAGKLEEVQRRIATAEVFQPFVAEVKHDWAHRPKELTGMPYYAGDIYLCTGKPDNARELYRYTLASMDWKLRQTFFGLGLTGYRFGHGYGMEQIAEVVEEQGREADVLLGSPYLTAAEKGHLRARLAAYGYVLTDPDFWPIHIPEYGKGRFNQVMSDYTSVGMLSGTWPGIPARKSGRPWGRAGSRRHCASHTSCPAAQIPTEGMHYAGVTLDAILPVMVMLKVAGGTDYFADPAFQRAMRWYAAWAPPVDARFGRSYPPPIGYSHPVDRSQSARWAIIATIMRQSDPAFSEFMMATWVKQGHPVKIENRRQRGGGDARPGAAGEDAGFARREVGRLGRRCRSHADDPRETFFALVASDPRWGVAHCGAFHFYAKGALFESHLRLPWLPFRGHALRIST